MSFGNEEPSIFTRHSFDIDENIPNGIPKEDKSRNIIKSDLKDNIKELMINAWESTKKYIKGSGVHCSVYSFNYEVFMRTSKNDEFKIEYNNEFKKHYQRHLYDNEITNKNITQKHLYDNEITNNQ